MCHKNLFTKSALAIAVSIIASNTYAAGFQLNEFSSIGLGRAYSGEGAVADTAASASRNPATMTMFNRPSLSAGAVFINPNINISGISSRGSSLNAKNVAPTAWVPNLHYVHPVNEQWALGGSLTSNYGLSTKFSPNYTAGPYGGITDLTTINTNLSTAYRLNKYFSLGFGLNAVYADATLERHAGESGRQLGLPADTTISHLEGKKWGYGANAGVLYEVDENNRYGFTYRSEVKVSFDGDYRSELPSRLNPVLSPLGLPLGTDGQTIPATLDLHLPEMWEISGYNKVAPQWAIHYSMAYTSWSQFEELRAIDSGGKTLFVKHEGFRDAYRMALGTTYSYDNNWTFRTGLAFDQSPAPATNRSISIPDQNRTWLSAGTSYAFNDDASVDIGVAYMHGQKVAINEGSYTFDADGSAWLYGASANYRF